MSQDDIRQQRLQTLSENYGRFQHCFRCNEPFVSPEVYVAIRELSDVIFNEAWDYRNSERRDDFKAYWDKAVENAKAINTHTDTICNAIRIRIGLIGSLQQSTEK